MTPAEDITPYEHEAGLEIAEALRKFSETTGVLVDEVHIAVQSLDGGHALVYSVELRFDRNRK